MIEDNAAEAALVAAALALRPEVQVVDAPICRSRWNACSRPRRLRAGDRRRPRAGQSTAELVGRLGAKGVPVVVIAAGLAADARQKALDTGVREVYDRPTSGAPTPT